MLFLQWWHIIISIVFSPLTASRYLSSYITIFYIIHINQENKNIVRCSFEVIVHKIYIVYKFKILFIVKHLKPKFNIHNFHILMIFRHKLGTDLNNERIFISIVDSIADASNCFHIFMNNIK